MDELSTADIADLLSRRFNPALEDDFVRWSAVRCARGFARDEPDAFAATGRTIEELIADTLADSAWVQKARARYRLETLGAGES